MSKAIFRDNILLRNPRPSPCKKQEGHTTETLCLCVVFPISRTGNEVSAPLSPPSRPTRASAVESMSPLMHSERTATVEKCEEHRRGARRRRGQLAQMAELPFVRENKKATRAAAPTVDRCRVESVGRLSLAGSEQEQIAPAPTNGAVSDEMRHPDHRSSPPDTDRVEHRSRGE